MEQDYSIVTIRFARAAPSRLNVRIMGESLSRESGNIDVFLASTLESVDDAEDLVLRAAGVSGLGEDESQRLGMAVREAVVNAVVHGNRYSSHKKVHLEVVKDANRIIVSVGDQGNGFDIKSVPDPLSEEHLLEQSGRGILLIRAFVDDFQIRRLAPSGTEVRLVKYLRRNA